MGPLLLDSFAELYHRRHTSGSGSRGKNSGGRSGNGGDSGGKGGGVGWSEARAELGGAGDVTRMRACHEANLPALSLQDGEKLRTILEGAVLPTLQVHVLFKNWHLCGLF